MSPRNTGSEERTRLRILASNVMRAALEEIVPQFERASGHSVSIDYDPAKLMLERIKRGETADVVILNVSAIEELAKESLVAARGRMTLARSCVGLAVRAGAPKPDIGSLEAFKRALHAAESIAYTESGASGMHFAGVIERLGIGAEVKAKSRTRPGGLIGELVAAGEAEIAIQQVPELMAVHGIDLVGPLPDEVQSVTVIQTGVFPASAQSEAVSALLDFLTSPDSARVMAAKGLLPSTGPY